jgi:hypothetical protein
MRVEFFLDGMKAEWVEGEGRILLGDNTGSGTLLLRRGSVKLDFKLDSLV